MMVMVMMEVAIMVVMEVVMMVVMEVAMMVVMEVVMELAMDVVLMVRVLVTHKWRAKACNMQSSPIQALCDVCHSAGSGGVLENHMAWKQPPAAREGKFLMVLSLANPLELRSSTVQTLNTEFL